jgi:hypothetical protein
MINATPETKLDGIAKQMRELSIQINTVFDVGLMLEVHCDWYEDADPRFGGPPTLENLMLFANRLRQAYMNMAAITGLDPCEQFDDSKLRIRKLREARAAGK